MVRTHVFLVTVLVLVFLQARVNGTRLRGHTTGRLAVEGEHVDLNVGQDLQPSEFDEVVGILKDHFGNETCSDKLASGGMTYVECYSDNESAVLLALGVDSPILDHFSYCSDSSCDGIDFTGRENATTMVFDLLNPDESEEQTEYEQLMLLLNDYFAEPGRCNTETVQYTTYVTCFRDRTSVQVFAVGLEPRVQNVFVCEKTACKKFNFVPGWDNLSQVEVALGLKD